jgi:hypothetical protein
MRRTAVREVVDLTFGDECEAFLAGHYLEWLRTEGLPVSPWAYVNRAAHADRLELEDIPPPHGPHRPRSWEEAEILIEAALLAGVPPDRFLVIQQALLLPLEFELMHQTSSPGSVVDRVCRAIYAIDSRP